MREFAQWQAFYRIHPFGELRGDLRSAIVAYTVAMTNRKKGAMMRIDQFMPKFESANKPVKSASEIRAGLLAWAKAVNKKHG